MSAPAPGQAAYEAHRTVVAASLGLDLSGPDDFDGAPGAWEALAPSGHAAWEAAAQAAVDVFLAGDSVSAESIREALAAQEQPAPGPGQDTARNQLIVLSEQYGNLVERFDAVTAECAALRALLGAAGPVKPSDDVQPAPGLAALLADWRKTADSLKGCRSAGDARERNTLEVVIGQVEAILARPSQAAPDTALRSGIRGLAADLEAAVRIWREESQPYPGEDAADSARRGGFGYCAGELAQILARHPALRRLPETP